MSPPSSDIDAREQLELATALAGLVQTATARLEGDLAVLRGQVSALEQDLARNSGADDARAATSGTWLTADAHDRGCRLAEVSGRLGAIEESLGALTEAAEAMRAWLTVVRWFRWAGSTARWLGVATGKFVGIPSAVLGLIYLVIRILAEAG